MKCGEADEMRHWSAIFRLPAGFAGDISSWFLFPLKSHLRRLWQWYSNNLYSEANSKIHYFSKAWEIFFSHDWTKEFYGFCFNEKENHQQEFSINGEMNLEWSKNMFQWDFHNEKKVQMVRGLKDSFLWCLAIFQAPRVRFYLLIRSTEYSRHMRLSLPCLMP